MERTGKRRPKSGCVGSVTSTSSGSSEDGLWNRAPWEALVRSSQPRYPDESRGATRFRQARAQADPGLSPGRGHGERTGQPERGGHTPRWPAVALVVEPAPGRPGPGAGASRSPVLPIRGRLQHLCADGACGPAGDGERDTLSDEASPAEGERVEECGGSTQGPEVSGIPLHLGQEREARHCAEGSAPVQGASPGADGSQPREECGRCREAPDQLPQWLGGLFRLLPDPERAGGTGRLDPPASAHAALAAMADVAEPETDAGLSWGPRAPCGGSRGVLSRPLGDGHAPGAPRGDGSEVLRPSGTAPAAEHDANVSRRTAVFGPVRTVVWEGRSREAPPYPDRHRPGPCPRPWHEVSSCHHR